MALQHQDGVTVDDHPFAPDVLGPPVQRFLGQLHRRFEPSRRLLRRSHECQHREHLRGVLPCFDPATAPIRANDWHIAPAPPDLVNRRTELTGPVTRAAMVEALNSGARVYMADFEDTTTPTWSNCVDGQRNLRDAYAGTLSADFDGEIRRPNATAATLMVRTRGWHLLEPSVTIDGEPMSASLFDFGVCVFNNARAAVAAGSAPYFYLPKFQGASDASLWRQVLEWTEDELSLDRGTIRTTVLIETIGAAFAMEEILFELRDHITGLHTGNWDYLFSMVKTFANDPSFIISDRADLTATTPFIRAFTELLVSTCHRRGAHAIGGMSGVIPDIINPARTASALRKVTVDKRREAGDGFDGTRIAQPALVAIAEREFDRVLSYRPHQLEVQRDDVYVTAGDLLAVRTARGNHTEAGLRHSIKVALHYLGEWLAGTGAVAIDDHLEDTAMAELCRSRIWQWRRHEVELSNGWIVTDDLLTRFLAEEAAALKAELGSETWRSGRFDDAFTLIQELTFSDTLAGFVPVEASHLIRGNPQGECQ